VECLSALLFGGYLMQMTIDGGEETLRDRVNAGTSPEAVWSIEVMNGRDRITFQLAIDGKGRYRLEVGAGPAMRWCEGEARLTEVEFILESGTSMLSILRSPGGEAE